MSPGNEARNLQYRNGLALQVCYRAALQTLGRRAEELNLDTTRVSLGETFGNRFLLVWRDRGPAEQSDAERRFWSALAEELCHRGLRLDDTLHVAPAERRGIYHFWVVGGDGRIASQCANGLLLAGWLAAMRGHRRSVLFRCGAQLRQVEQLDGSLARVNLGMPRLLPRGAEPQPSSLLTAPWLVHTGEPHAVNFENELAIAEPPYHNRFLELGREICAAYRNGGINWNLVAAVNGTLHIRTFERGVRRMTRSCGTGSAAAFVIALLNGHIERRQTLVKSAGGTHVLAMHDGEVLLAGRPQVQRHLRLDELLYSAASVSAHES